MGDLDSLSEDTMEKVRQQFDAAPYPNIPLAAFPDDGNYCFIHNMVTAYYLRDQRVVNPAGKMILDVGCGSGYKALVLAIANPGATIVGIDLSAQSVALARERLHYHGIANCEFHQLALEDLSSLGMSFDYINCDEVLSLLPELTTGLQAVQSVLKPGGMMRANVHSMLQRSNYYAAQQMFALMGLVEGTPSELELGIAKDTMFALNDEVMLKRSTWYEQSSTDEAILMNYFLQGDRGYTVPDLFAALRNANLEFVSMVDWRSWELLDLFNNPNDLPAFWAMCLPELSTEEQLTIYELIQPKNRLLDFWCGHPSHDPSPIPVAAWSPKDWQGARVHLHPQLKTESIQEDFCTCIADRRGVCLSHHLSHPTVKEIILESNLATILLPLWESDQAIEALVHRWQRLKPVDPITLEPVSQQQAFEQVTQMLIRLENYLYVLIERQ